MTIQQFKQRFCLKETITNNGVTLTITTKVIEKSTNKSFDEITATIDIQEANEWINDSNSYNSITPWSSDKLIDTTKRFQIDWFAQRAGIRDWFPLNREMTPDISDLYCK